MALFIKSGDYDGFHCHSLDYDIYTLSIWGQKQIRVCRGMCADCRSLKPCGFPDYFESLRLLYLCGKRVSHGSVWHL
jgi:hypothetical protein